MATISICMIVKNEEKVLSRALDCAKEFADEIVVVDTGSTDKTKEIAKRYTDKIYDFKWVDDFSKARNFAFSKATCDYQMWLDADDIITEENILKLKKLKTSLHMPDIYLCKYTTGKDNELTYYRERLMKRSSHFVWQGFIHEAIAPRGNVVYTDIEIHHKKEEPSDPKRNLKMYKNALKKGVKFDAREQYYYARELYYNKFISSCIKEMKKFLKMNGYPPDDLCGHIILSDCYVIKHEEEKALKILKSAMFKHAPTPELCCKIGFIFDSKNNGKQAIFWYKMALMCDPQITGFVYKDFADLIPFLQLTKLLYNSGRYDEARSFHLLAKELAPTHPSVVYNDKFFK